MTSYRLARRSFLQGIGAGAFGLKTMLRTMEASAQGMTSPPRLLITHWPVGTIHALYKPTGSGSSYTTSPILAPFEGTPPAGQTAAPSLRNDMIVLFGMTTEPRDNAAWNIPGGGGHEAGTMKMMCGTGSPGTRQEPVKVNDAVAGGPSWDQIFLKNVPALSGTSLGLSGYANAICDSRVDTSETSTQCLSYDHATRSIPSANPGGNIIEHIPLFPYLSPINLYNALFSGMTPGGSMSNADMIRLLKAKKSVLDFSLAQLASLQKLAPASEASKIMSHADAIRAVETQLSTLLSMGADGGSVSSSCTYTPMMPDPTLSGLKGNGDKPNMGDYINGPTMHTVNDAPLHAQIGAAHFAIIRAAFQCDIIRVATFQWSPGTNHVSFQGLYPNVAGPVMHHPTSHVLGPGEGAGPMPAAGLHQDVWNFLANVHNWYCGQFATLINTFKSATDIYGGNLLANTIIPQVTCISEASHEWAPMPALIFGGSALGMKGGQYVDVSGGSANARSLNSMWISVAQAFFQTSNPLPNLANENFIKTGLAPIPGLWA